MIDTINMENCLRRRYPDIEVVGERVFRAVDRHDERDYAVRYFDLNDNLSKTAPDLNIYQEQMLSEMYFSTKTATDLRWNHYLYFVTSEEKAKSNDFKHWKAIVEADQEYARKQVIFEAELVTLLTQKKTAVTASTLPVDLATTLMKQLDEKELGFILNETITVPEAVRQIEAGQKKNASKVVSPLELLTYEKAAANHHLKSLTIHGFRLHPLQKNHQFGRVNLILGINGVGKTSLLEAIEFAYCGKNRRNDVVENKTTIISELFGSDEKLVSSTIPDRQRSRNAHWYAKTDVVKVTIEDSFGKFNFLDTDAAVRLSVKDTSGLIGKEVSRLMLGAEAEKLSDRLRRVKERTDEELRIQNSSLNDQKKNLILAKSRLDAISKSPKQSDSLYEEFQVALKHAGWKELPTQKELIQSLRSSLQLAIASIELLQKSKFDLLQGSEGSLQQLFAELNADVALATKLDAQHRSAALEATEVQRKVQLRMARNSTLAALFTYARSDYQELLSKSQALQESINAKSARLGTFKSFPISEQVAKYGNHLIVTTVETVLARLIEIKKHLRLANDSLSAFKKTQSSLALLRQRLTATVQELLSSMPNPDHCPVCHTQFEQGQLTIRMLADSTPDVNEQMGHLQSEIVKLENEIAATDNINYELQSLVHFVGDSARNITVAQALSLLDRERIAHDQEEMQLSIIQDQLAQLQANGLTSNQLMQKLVDAGLSTLPSVGEIQALHSESEDILKHLQIESKAVQDKQEIVQQEVEVLATRYSLKASSATDVLLRGILSELASFETAREARSTLLEFVNISAATRIENVAVSIAAAQELLVRVVTAVDQEKFNSESLAKEYNTIQSLEHTISEIGVKAKRLDEANLLLTELIKQSSGGELTDRILAENAEEIGRTFSRIHMPNEFVLKTENGKLKIIRKQTGSAVDLNEMSTGQRAAFALSLFISMNARLQNGPRVLLFDDPVAHVDDINVLSFLDYLRDVAIKGERQIFYATADTKLAGLFRHKFQFLGPDQFKEIQLTRE